MKKNSNVAASDGGECKSKALQRARTCPKEFKKTAEALVKRISELSTLCDVPACLVIRSPEAHGKHITTYSWSSSSGGVRSVFEKFKSVSGSQKKGSKTAGTLVGQKGLEKDVLSALDAKIEHLKVRIQNEMMKSEQECTSKVNTDIIIPHDLQPAATPMTDVEVFGNLSPVMNDSFWDESFFMDYANDASHKPDMNGSSNAAEGSSAVLPIQVSDGDDRIMDLINPVSPIFGGQDDELGYLPTDQFLLMGSEEYDYSSFSFSYEDDFRAQAELGF